MTIFTTLLVILLAAAATFLFIYSATSWIVDELAGEERAPTPRVTKNMGARPLLWSRLAERAEPHVPARIERLLKRNILMAGGLQGATPAEIVLAALLIAMFSCAFGLLLLAYGDWSPWVVLSLCLLGSISPFVWLRDRVKGRHQQILRDLPFHLDLLTLSVEAGLDFSAAVARMVQKGKPGALREEFSTFLGEIRMGKTRAESLEAMSERVGLPALSSFLGALIQADRLGSGLGRTLRLQSEQQRSDRFQRAEKAAGEAPVKMLLPLVLFIFPTIWIILAAPLVFEWLFKAAS